MARRKKRRFGWAAEEHRRIAPRSAAHVRHLVKLANDELRQGDCAQAIRYLTTADYQRGIAEAHAGSSGRRAKGGVGGMFRAVHKLQKRVIQACAKPPKAKSGWRSTRPQPRYWWEK